MPLRLLIIAALALFLSPASEQPAASAGSISVDASRLGHPIPSSLYGIFFEEISHAGEGGLYAELVQNRGLGDIIIKVVNAAAEPQAMTLQLKDVPKFGSRATATVLTSGSPLDENTFEEPTKIVPKTAPIKPSTEMTHTFPAHSLTIFRISTR